MPLTNDNVRLRSTYNQSAFYVIRCRNNLTVSCFQSKKFNKNVIQNEFFIVSKLNLSLRHFVGMHLSTNTNNLITLPYATILLSLLNVLRTSYYVTGFKSNCPKLKKMFVH